ncbi:HK97 family phage prohead protease [Mesorhizobium sp. M0435]|uniref:HK97 family phage prohead protease n=1 Tax=Mesorhizobium sp. M0435 TaxID=2956944 RepID=UPI00333A2339
MAGLFVEQFARGSFDKSLLHNPDVAALWSHDSSRPLGCVGRRDSKYRSGPRMPTFPAGPSRRHRAG